MKKGRGKEFSIFLDKAKNYATRAHRSTNHKYDGRSYVTHLEIAYEYGEKYRHLIPEEVLENVLAAIWAHDVIEDCRETYNDVKYNLNEDVANLVYAVTNEKGRNRKERANEKYYKGIRETPFALYVKLCDLLANVKYSFDNNSSMIDMYKKEWPHFKEKTYSKKYKEMFEELSSYLDEIKIENN